MIRLFVVVAVLGFMLSGCVSTSTYKKMETAKNQEIAALQGEKALLVKDKNDLNQQTISLQQGKLTAEQGKLTAEQQVEAEKQRIAALEQEKAALLTASQQEQKQYEELVQGLSQEVEKGQLQVRQYKNMLSVDLAEQIFFDSGRAKLKAGGKEVLKKVGEVLKGYENKIIRVVGHTDNVPVSKSLQTSFPSNWDLSVARATTVVRFLQDVGVPPERMVPSGRGEYDPIAPNDTKEGRQQNRRIEIMLLDQSLASELSRGGK